METTLTRRSFPAGSSCFGAAALLARTIPLPAMAERAAQDPRVAEAPPFDKGFAAVRRVGQGVYATISDFSKGPQTNCNGGFLVGAEAALIIEGHRQPAGAAFELEGLRIQRNILRPRLVALRLIICNPRRRNSELEN
jgi:hypothetical protein